MKKLAIVIGRFQPIHNGHLQMLAHARTLASHVMVLAGSVNAEPSFKNPIDFHTRRRLFKAAIQTLDFDPNTFSMNPLDDANDDDLWAAQVKQHAYTHLFQRLSEGDSQDVVLVGHPKDASSYYLKLFPEWELSEFQMQRNIDATAIRELMRNHDNIFDLKAALVPLVPEPTIPHLLDWLIDADGHAMLRCLK